MPQWASRRAEASRGPASPYRGCSLSWRFSLSGLAAGPPASFLGFQTAGRTVVSRAAILASSLPLCLEGTLFLLRPTTSLNHADVMRLSGLVDSGEAGATRHLTTWLLPPFSWPFRSPRTDEAAVCRGRPRRASQASSRSDRPTSRPPPGAARKTQVFSSTVIPTTMQVSPHVVRVPTHMSDALRLVLVCCRASLCTGPFPRMVLPSSTVSFSAASLVVRAPGNPSDASGLWRNRTWQPPA